MHTQRITQTSAQTRAGFTLLELLTVIAIIGILAAIVLPNMRSFQPNLAGTAARQLLDDIGRARQLAISQRTTVYMIFVPTNFWTDVAYGGSVGASATEVAKAQRLFDKQMIGYTFVSLRSVGDQPGRSQPHYWTSWKTLPRGGFIPVEKFYARNLPPINQPRIVVPTNDLAGNKFPAYWIKGFSTTNVVPFPSEDTTPDANGKFVTVPYIAFDDRGQLLSGENEMIPLAKGSVLFVRNGGGPATNQSPQVIETPPGNASNTFNIVSIDWLTGRGRIEKQEIR